MRYLFDFEDMPDEKLLQVFVSIIYAELLEAEKDKVSINQTHKLIIHLLRTLEPRASKSALV